MIDEIIHFINDYFEAILSFFFYDGRLIIPLALVTIILKCS